MLCPFIRSTCTLQITLINSEVDCVTIASDDSGGFVTLDDQSVVPFDYVVLATGSKPRLELIPGSETCAAPFYNLEDVDSVKVVLEDLIQRATPRE